jgi:hypothetical protein
MLTKSTLFFKIVFILTVKIDLSNVHRLADLGALLILLRTRSLKKASGLLVGLHLWCG